MKNIGITAKGYASAAHGIKRRIRYAKGAHISQTKKIVP